MKKMPCLFQRDFNTPNTLVRDEVTSGCEWVLNGEGIATVKIDGTSCLIKDGILYKRYDAKHGKIWPIGFLPAQPEADLITGHWPGWLKVDPNNPDNKWHLEAIRLEILHPDWTYELIGPKVQDNPYDCTRHVLVKHGQQECVDELDRDFLSIKSYLSRYEWLEGIVFWRDINDLDCEKCKIRRKDFGFDWPVKRLS